MHALLVHAEEPDDHDEDAGHRQDLNDLGRLLMLPVRPACLMSLTLAVTLALAVALALAVLSDWFAAELNADEQRVANTTASAEGEAAQTSNGGRSKCDGYGQAARRPWRLDLTMLALGKGEVGRERLRGGGIHDRLASEFGVGSRKCSRSAPGPACDRFSVFRSVEVKNRTSGGIHRVAGQILR